MNITIVDKENKADNADLLKEMFQYRHHFFVEEMGWESLRKSDGLERDQFDNDDATYMIFQEDNGTFVGCLRLLPTTGPHLFSEVFPNLCNKTGLQRGEKIWELTRTCINLEYGYGYLMGILVSFCEQRNISALTMLAPLNEICTYQELGIEFEQLGDNVPMHDSVFQPVLVDIEKLSKTIAAMQ